MISTPTARWDRKVCLMIPSNLALAKRTRKSAFAERYAQRLGQKAIAHPDRTDEQDVLGAAQEPQRKGGVYQSPTHGHFGIPVEVFQTADLLGTGLLQSGLQAFAIAAIESSAWMISRGSGSSAGPGAPRLCARPGSAASGRTLSASAAAIGPVPSSVLSYPVIIAAQGKHRPATVSNQCQARCRMCSSPENGDPMKKRSFT